MTSERVDAAALVAERLAARRRRVRTIRRWVVTCAVTLFVAVVVHGLSLLGDTYFPFTLANVTIPFLAPYKNLFTLIGIIAGWGMIILGLSYYARRPIGQSRWRTIHRFTALAWLLGLAHAFAEGTDAGKLWFIALMALTAAPALVLLIVRHARPRAPTRGALTPAA